jgi:hypothetical protein
MGFSPLFKKWFRDDSILVPGESLANSGVSQLTHPAFRGVTVRGDDFATEKRGQSLTGPTLSLGFAIMFRSIIGVALVPAWWAGFLFIVLAEEESLERTLGQPYLDYKQRVKGRIIPGLPI